MTIGELERAYRMLQDQGVECCIRKISTGTSGDGIVLVRDRDDLLRGAFTGSPIEILEEKVEIARDESGHELTPSIQFNGSEVLGVSAQRVDGYAFAGNCFPSGLGSELEEQILVMARSVLFEMNPLGPGGLDFLIAAGDCECPVLVDPNLGRSTGAHPLHYFRMQYALPGSVCITQKIDAAEITGDIWSFWHKLERQSLHFLRHTRAGVAPLVFLPGMYAMLLAVGEDRAEAESLMHRAIALVG